MGHKNVITLRRNVLQLPELCQSRDLLVVILHLDFVHIATTVPEIYEIQQVHVQNRRLRKPIISVKFTVVTYK